jgi:hypothetical protein
MMTLDEEQLPNQTIIIFTYDNVENINNGA